MDPRQILAAARAAGVNLEASGDRLLASPSAAVTPELRGLIRSHKPALLRLLSDESSTSSVVRLALTLEAADGQRWRAVLAVPRARYDGLAILAEFERHQVAGTSRVVEVRPAE